MQTQPAPLSAPALSAKTLLALVGCLLIEDAARVGNFDDLNREVDAPDVSDDVLRTLRQVREVSTDRGPRLDLAFENGSRYELVAARIDAIPGLGSDGLIEAQTPTLGAIVICSYVGRVENSPYLAATLPEGPILLAPIEGATRAPFWQVIGL